MNFFKNSIVQDRIADFFSHCISNDRLAHAYIFYGNEGRGKEAFSFELAKALNCTDAEIKPCNECPSCIKINNFNHPDIKYIFPSSKSDVKNSREIISEKSKNLYAPLQIKGHKNIAIETIRELKNEAKYAPFEAAKRVFIIYGADYFSREAANSFLKLLEEPPADLLIILITDNIHSLLDTIRSRCQPVHFPEFSIEQITEIVKKYEESEENIESLIRLSQFNVKKIFNILKSDYQSRRELVYKFLKAAAVENYFTISALIDELTQKRDKNYILEFLDLLALWLQDALHFSITGSSADFVNQDYKEAVQKFAEFYQDADFDNIIRLVEKYYFFIKYNAHPALTLTNLAIELHRLLTQKKAVKEAV